MKKSIKKTDNILYSTTTGANKTDSTKEYTIDAKGQKMGRVATQAAHILMGKNSVFFVKNRAPDVAVTILNASKVVISEKHLQNNTYARFSGYQGGLKFDTLEALIERHGYKEAVKRAIKGMIPSTKLRPGMLKRLIITD
ncbi:MAG: uL13 family ribosomal protein [Patescibacteria group bacterium]